MFRKIVLDLQTLLQVRQLQRAAMMNEKKCSEYQCLAKFEGGNIVWFVNVPVILRNTASVADAT